MKVIGNVESIQIVETAERDADVRFGREYESNEEKTKKREEKEKMGGEGVFRAIANGVHERGEGGVAYVKGEECGYLFPHEFKSEDFASGLQDAIDAGGSTHFFVVEERDKKLHVLAYEKKHVYSSLSSKVCEEVQDEVRIEEGGGGEEGESSVRHTEDPRP